MVFDSIRRAAKRDARSLRRDVARVERRRGRLPVLSARALCRQGVLNLHLQRNTGYGEVKGGTSRGGRPENPFPATAFKVLRTPRIPEIPIRASLLLFPGAFIPPAGGTRGREFGAQTRN